MLDIHIKNFLEVTRIQALLICTSEGRVFKKYGYLNGIDMESFGVLMASHISASSGLSQLLNQHQLFEISLHGNINIYACTLNKNFFVITLSDKNTHQGYIKFELEQKKDLLLEELEKEDENRTLSHNTQELLFEEIQDKEIDRLFENL